MWGGVKGVLGWGGGILRVLLPPMRVVMTLSHANGNHGLNHCGQNDSYRKSTTLHDCAVSTRRSDVTPHMASELC